VPGGARAGKVGGESVIFVLADPKNRGMADVFFGRTRGRDPGRFRLSMARRSPEVTELHSQTSGRPRWRGASGLIGDEVPGHSCSRVLLAHKSREEQHQTAGSVVHHHLRRHPGVIPSNGTGSA
jgi:hypothetical protein